MVSSTSNQFNPLRQEGQAPAAATPAKTGRFGLPIADASTAKITDLGTKTPATNLNGELKDLTFSGKLMTNGTQAKEEKASFVFKNNQETSSATKPPRSGEILIRNTNQSLNGSIKDQGNGAAKVANQGVKEAKSISWANIESQVKAGEGHYGRINDINGTVVIEKLNKNIDFSKDKNCVLILNGIIVSTPNRENKLDFRNYQVITKDPTLKKDLDHIQENFRNASVYLATKEELNTLNLINQSRLENTTNHDEKIDDSMPKDNKKVETKPQQTDNLKIKEEILQKNQSNQLKQEIPARSTSFIDEEKTDKATIQKQNEEVRMKKKEEDIKASLSNEQKIDERVLSRLKNQKN